MSAKKRRLSSSVRNESSILASPLLSEFSNSFVESMMSNDENTDKEEEPLSLVQSLRLRMDAMERESAERQKAMANLPHMKRFKSTMKKRQIKQILQEVADEELGERIKSTKKRKRTTKFLAITGIEKSIRETIIAVVHQLGEYEIQGEVGANTTHVVSGGKRRTLNVLKAILSGCWLLSVEWVMKSLEKGFWLNEEPYELAEKFPAAKLLRKERVLSRSTYHCRLLADIGPIFISPCTSPPLNDITKLIQLSGGVITGSARRASVCIGKISAKTDGVQVTEKWLLDCITRQTVLPFEEYQQAGNS